MSGIEELTNVLETFVAGSAPDKALKAMLIAYAEFALADHNRFRVLFLENDEGELDLLAGGYDALAPYKLVKACVSVAVREGILSGDVDRTTQILWASVHGAVTLLVTVHEIEFGNTDTFINETIDATLRGLQQKDV